MKTNRDNVKNPAIILSVLMGFIVITQLLFVFINKNTAAKPLDIGDFSNYDVLEIEQQYKDRPTNDNLLLLIKVLCYESEVNNNEESRTLIKQYGSELFSRAKRNEIDLSSVDSEAVMLEIIRIIKYYGAR